VRSLWKLSGKLPADGMFQYTPDSADARMRPSAPRSGISLLH